MKLNRFFMLGLVGLAFAACGNEDEAENALAQGNGAVSIKIVSPTANSRAVTSDSPDGTIKVTGPATVSLTATFDGEEKIKTIDLARGETEAKFWNVTNPTLVTVSMNDGTKVYTTSINDVTMQVTEISYEKSVLMIFKGYVDGRMSTLIQHISQLNFLLTSLLKDDSRPKQHIGFVVPTSE